MITDKVILLDAGHGGINDMGVYVTPGKRSSIWEDVTQYFEGCGNRMIRDEIAKLLKEANVSYHFINVGFKDIELFQRVNIANALCQAYGVDNCLLISIHSNGFKEERANGWEGYTSPGYTSSDPLMESLYKYVAEEFPGHQIRVDTVDGDPDKEANFSMVVGPACKAVLSENFFHTNEDECRNILMTVTGRKKIARAHFRMIMDFINDK